MRFEINFTNRTSSEKGWAELEMLSTQLMGGMTFTKGTSGMGDEIVIVNLEKIDDTVALMKTLKEMANKGIRWIFVADWWSNTDKED